MMHNTKSEDAKIMPKVSIITPVYNSDKYIGRAIESVLAQTYTDWELIIINDGSRDKTAQIIKEFANKDKRIVYLNQKNAGASAARNKGIAAAKGDYIMFLDADDSLSSTIVEVARDKAEKTNVDIVFYNFAYIYDDDESNKVISNIKPVAESDVYSRKELSKTLFQSFATLTWNKLIKKEVITKNDIYFNVNYPRYNDVDFSIRLITKAKTYAWVDTVGYLYRVSTVGSITSTKHKYPTAALEMLIDLNQTIPQAYKASFYNYTIEQIYGNMKHMESDYSAHKKAFDFSSREVVSALKLDKFNTDELYNRSLTEFFSSVVSNKYDSALLAVVKMQNMEIRAAHQQLSSLDQQLHNLDQHASNLDQQIHNLTLHLDKIHQSKAYKIAKKLQRIKNKITK